MIFIKSTAISTTLGALCGLALIPHVLAQAGSAVTISGFRFVPDTIDAAPNVPIKWTNNDGTPHRIVIASKKLMTPVLTKNHSEELKIDAAGSYDYICGIHPSMKGRIVVK